VVYLVTSLSAVQIIPSVVGSGVEVLQTIRYTVPIINGSVTSTLTFNARQIEALDGNSEDDKRQIEVPMRNIPPVGRIVSERPN